MRSAARWLALAALLSFSVAAVHAATTDEPERCAAEGWMAGMTPAEREYLKSKKLCPEDVAEKDSDKSPFASPIELQLGSKVAIKGAEIFPRDARRFFTTLDVDAVWEPGSKGRYTSSAGLRPTYTRAVTTPVRGFPGCASPLRTAGLERIPGHSFQLYGDLRQRIGDFEKSGSDQTERVEQFLYGVGADVRIFLFWLRELERLTRSDSEYPRLALTYYRVREGSQNIQDPPDGVNAGQLQLAFSAEFPLRIVEGEKRRGDDAAYERYYQELLRYAFCDGADRPATEPVEPRITSYYPWSVSLDVRASRAVDSDDQGIEPYADVAIKYRRPGARLGYLMRYRSGKDLGLEFGDEVIVGLMFRAFE
ncbi:MAG TPA: hypothetical protein VNM92_18285 [Thermoanaerobaculia bacterium]|nr:hypothetical protein [Thermoanaerobaculia bacterium]